MAYPLANTRDKTPPSRKFMFDVSFDDPNEDRRVEVKAPEPEPEETPESLEPPPPPEPMFSEAQLIAERSKAYDEGRRAGSEEAWSQFRTQTDQIAVKALKVIGDQLQGLFSQQQAAAEQCYRDSMTIAVAVCNKMLPELARRNGMAEVEAVLKETVAKLIGEPKVVIRVHEQVVEHVARRLETLLEEAGFEGRVQLQIDNKIGVSDVRIEWAGGGLYRDTDKLWSELDRLIYNTFGVHAEPLPLPDDPDGEAAAGAATDGAQA